MQKQFLKDRDIVLFSFQSWDSEIGFNLKDMAYELAKKNRVLFVNRADDRASLMPDKKDGLFANKKTRENLEQVERNFWLYNSGLVLESINWIAWSWLYDQFNKANNRRISKKINKAIRELGFQNVILINDNDFYRGLYLKKMVRQCSTYIFYIRDFLTIQPYFKKHGVRLEQQMIHNSDLVVANSGYLAKYAAKWNRYSYDIGQGCDLEAYQAIEYPMPADLAEIPHPVIGYCGAITAMRLDESIVSHLAESFPECSIVLVGPEDDFFRKSSLKDLKNVFFLGGKTPREVPSYISHFDICINPQLTNELTIGNYPRKIDEYLAMGKPTVATATDGMLIFKDNVFLCNSKKEYADQIRKILMDPNLSGDEIKRERINFALSHTWENSIGLLGGAYFDSIKKN